MAIKLPDIVQRVVLDTKKFSAGNAGARKELASTAQKAGEAGDAVEKAGKQHDETGRKTDQHSSKAQRFNRVMKQSTPSLLRLADSLYKVRNRHVDAGKATEDHNRKAGRLGRTLTRLRKGAVKGLMSAIKGLLKFMVKWGALLGLIATAAAFLVPVIGSMVGALSALIGSLGRVIGLLPALSGGLLGIVAVAGVAITAFSGVGKAMKNQQKAGAAAGKSAEAVARAQESGAKAVAAAQKGVIAATKALQDAREAEADAYLNVTETQYQAQRQIADATRSQAKAEQTLAEAQARTRSSRDALTASFERARRNIIELRRETERADISQQRSEISLRNARKAYQELLSSGTATPDEITSAMLDVESAELDVLDATDRLTDSRKAQADADRKGIENSDAVTEARNDLIDAQNEEADAAYELRQAEIDLAETQYEAAKSVAEARKDAADATEAVAEAVQELAEAEAAVGEARRDAARGVADAADSGGGGGASDGDPPSKEAVAIAAALKETKDSLKPIKKLIQGITFKDIISGIRKGGKVLLGFTDEIGETAGIVGKHFNKYPDYLAMASPSLKNIWKANNNLIDSMGDFFGVFTVGAARMAEAGSFVLDHFAGVADDVAERMRNAIADPEWYGKMQVFFLKALNSAILWWRMLRDFTIGLIKFFGAGADVGDSMAESGAKAAAAFREWTSDEGNRAKVADWMERMRDLWSKIWGFLKQVIWGLAGIATGPAVEALGDLFDRFGKANRDADNKSLQDVITALGTKAVVDVSNAIIGVMDALAGEKEASTNVEKLAVSFTSISDITGAFESFVGVLETFANALEWIVDEVPGAKAIIGGIAGVMAAMKVAKMLGIGGAIRGVGRAAMFVNDQRNGMPKLVRNSTDMNRAIGATPARSKWRIVNFLRGVKAEAPGANTQLKATDDHLRRMNGAVDSGGAALDKGKSKFRKFGSAAMGAASGVGMAGGALWALGSVVGDNALGDALNKVGGGMVLIGSVAEIGNTLGSMAKGMQATDKATKGAAASQNMFNASLLANPITWIVLAIIALGAAIYALYKNNDGFRKWIDNIWQKIQEMWDNVLPILENLWEWISEKVVGAFEWVAETAGKVWGFVTEAMGTAWGIIEPILGAIWTVIDTVVIPAFKLVWEVVKVVWNAIALAISLYWNYYVKPIFSAIWFVIREVLIPIFKMIWAIVKDVWNGISVAISAAWDFISPIFSSIWDWISNTLVPVFQDVWDKASEVWEGITDAISDAWDFVKPIFEKIKQWLEDYVKGPFEDAAEAIGDAWEGISGAVTGAFEGAKTAMNKVLKAIGDVLSPILSGAGTIADAVGMDNLATTLKDTSKSVGKWGEEKASGGVIEAKAGWRFQTAPRTTVGAGFKTGTPRAIVGEGSRHPEYVIPTDPAYRTRAKSLLDAAQRDLSIGPTGRFSANAKAKVFDGNYKFPDYSKPEPTYAYPGQGLVDKVKNAPGDVVNAVKDAGRGVIARGVEAVWPSLSENLRPQTFPAGFPGNAYQTLRQDVIDAIKGKVEEKDQEQQAAVAAASLLPSGSITGLNKSFLALFNLWNQSVGNRYRVYSGWRSSERQAQLYQAYLNGTGNLAAPPGSSRHEYGLAIDTAPNATAGHRAAAIPFGMHFNVPSEAWHVEPINLGMPGFGTAYQDLVAPLWGQFYAKGGKLGDGIPSLATGGIITDEILARIGENGREAVVPLDSIEGRKMLDGGQPQVLIDMRGSTFGPGVDPKEIAKAVEEGVEQALDTATDYIEIEV